VAEATGERWKAGDVHLSAVVHDLPISARAPETMVSLPVHRELLLPTPTEEPPETPPFVWNTGGTFSLEIHRGETGRVRFALVADDAAALESIGLYLENSHPRLVLGRPVDCPILTSVRRGVLAYAAPRLRHCHLPFLLQLESDPASLLLRTLGSRTLSGHDAVLQLLFRRVPVWESGILSGRYDAFANRQERHLRTEMDARRNQPAYHVELRARLSGPRPAEALTALGAWLEQWTTPGGVPWRSWEVIPRKFERDFHRTLGHHSLSWFPSRKASRDISAAELAHLLPIPWATRHPECSYSGAPSGRPSSELVLRAAASPRPETRLVVGASDGQRVCLPREWNHLAVLGRTQSGKSTLALNLALQLLAKRPAATVVVVEPTGTLVEGIVSRLTRTIASDTVEIDPAHATFEKDGTQMVSVPIGLLRPTEAAEEDPAVQSRWSEALAGDLLAAIRNAWGEESIGGRAELVLRALVQGLALSPGSNLVDAYHILSSKPALQRFVRTAPPGPLRDFLEHHLPRLGYEFTMSSLDKVGKIATNPLLRVALCQRRNPVSFDQLLGHRLVLLNLSKAALGADGANFLGAIYLTQLWASLQRSGRPDRPVYLFLDEAHNYAIPTLADMLSEGAKFGLHVVAVTQYFHRVPQRVRAALVGNVDAWLLFTLGSEDMDDALRVVNGEAHGWRPDDLVDGLRPHEVAMGVSGPLLKLETLPSPPPGALAGEARALVAESSRRYAQPEDSEASPWLVGQEEAELVLRSLSNGPRTKEEIACDTALPPDRLSGALALAVAAADVDLGVGDGLYRLAPRGEIHLEVLQARRNEGEEHVETLTEFAMFLSRRGIAITIPPQVAGILLPDGQFQWGADTYNVEVECSTLSKAGQQVVRNVKKAWGAGRRVLIVVPDRSSISRALALLNGAFPGKRLWTDGVGLVWKEGKASFHAFGAPGARVWPFLEPKDVSLAPDETEAGSESSEHVTAPEAMDTDPLVDKVRAIALEMIARGKTQATSREIRDCLPAREREWFSEHRVGTILSHLGLTSRRIWTDGTRPRVYELSMVRSVPFGPGEMRSGPGPTDPDASRVEVASPTDEIDGGTTGDRTGPAD
jgi:hypothetical protein